MRVSCDSEVMNCSSRVSSSSSVLWVTRENALLVFPLAAASHSTENVAQPGLREPVPPGLADTKQGNGSLLYFGCFYSIRCI